MCKTNRVKQKWTVCIIPVVILAVSALLYAQNAKTEPPADLHTAFDGLLQRYVSDTRFDYAAVFKDKASLKQLYLYVDTLETQDPRGWSRKNALAFWINLYNAATLELVLKNYPLKSIKDIGGIFKSPWKHKVVSVNGEDFTLNQIENKVIRPRFKDARIHFALNCASIGCPPLAARAYMAETLEAQLEQVTRNALNDQRWVNITPEAIRLTRIFDWYAADFKNDAGTVRKFIAKYRQDSQRISDTGRKIRFFDYDWRLNQAE